MVEGESEETYFNRIARLTDAYSFRVKISRDKRPLDMIDNCFTESSRIGLDDDDLRIAVFDLDVVSPEELERSVRAAREKHVEIMSSNLSFEVWLLMHLCNVTRAYTQDDYEEILSGHIGHRYRKSEGLKERITLGTIRDAIERGRGALAIPDPMICKDTPNSSTLWKLLSDILDGGSNTEHGNHQ